MDFYSAFFRLLRPKQWVKNVFVVLPLLFSGLLRTDRATESIGYAALAFGLFCAWSSAVYIMNDICDRKSDRQHPRKRNRPIASGEISLSAAWGVVVVLAVLPFAAWHTLPCGVFLAGGLFLANNLLYCLKLRSVAIGDVFSIAIGFVLRILGGCFALGVEPSQWILMCGFSLALLLGFGKRRMEMSQEARLALRGYSVEFLNILLGVTAAIALMSYLLYTLAPQTEAIHHTKNLIYATPFVFYGVFRYVWLSLLGKFDGPDEVFYKDVPFAVNGLLWAIAIFIILIL